jgi:hypothetical protein
VNEILEFAPDFLKEGAASGEAYFKRKRSDGKCQVLPRGRNKGLRAGNGILAGDWKSFEALTIAVL